MIEPLLKESKNDAKSNNTSLSKLIESYLKMLTKQKNKSIVITPLVDSLSGIISVDKDFDAKDLYSDHLIDKHK